MKNIIITGIPRSGKTTITEKLKDFKINLKDEPGPLSLSRIQKIIIKQKF